jgi:hypothetical protein
MVYITPARPVRLAAALMPLNGRASNTGYTVSYRSTRPGRARLAVLDERGHTIASVAAHARRGLNRIGLGRWLRPAIYTVQLTLSAAGQNARHAVQLYLGGTLPLPYARSLVPESIDFGGSCSNCDPDVHPTSFEVCRRISAVRVDCRYSYEDGDDEQTCDIQSAQLQTQGTLFIREYDCPLVPGIPAHPPLGSLTTILPQQPYPSAPATRRSPPHVLSDHRVRDGG